MPDQPEKLDLRSHDIAAEKQTALGETVDAALSLCVSKWQGWPGFLEAGHERRHARLLDGLEAVRLPRPFHPVNESEVLNSEIEEPERKAEENAEKGRNEPRMRIGDSNPILTNQRRQSIPT